MVADDFFRIQIEGYSGDVVLFRIILSCEPFYRTLLSESPERGVFLRHN